MRLLRMGVEAMKIGLRSKMGVVVMVRGSMRGLARLGRR